MQKWQLKHSEINKYLHLRIQEIYKNRKERKKEMKKDEITNENNISIKNTNQKQCDPQTKQLKQ